MIHYVFSILIRCAGGNLAAMHEHRCREFRKHNKQKTTKRIIENDFTVFIYYYIHFIRYYSSPLSLFMLFFFTIRL